jgi:hypothetical protein
MILLIGLLAGCNSKKKEVTNSFDKNYYLNQMKLFISEEIKNETEIRTLIEKYFYKPEEIYKSENYDIIIGLLGEYKIVSKNKKTLHFINEEILQTERKGELDTNFCDCSVLYTNADTSKIFFSCYKFGKIFSIMPIWDGNKEMKITWLR